MGLLCVCVCIFLLWLFFLKVCTDTGTREKKAKQTLGFISLILFRHSHVYKKGRTEKEAPIALFLVVLCIGL